MAATVCLIVGLAGLYHLVEVRQGPGGGASLGQRLNHFRPLPGRECADILAGAWPITDTWALSLLPGLIIKSQPDSGGQLTGFWLDFCRMQQRYCNLHRVDAQSIFWFVEFQIRGAPHLHFFYTHPVPWRAAAELWARACNREGLDGGREDFALRSTKFERLRSGIRGAASYATKYASKMDQKDAPAWWAGRFWGVRGCRELGGCHKIMDDSRVRGPARADFDRATEIEVFGPLREAERAGLIRGLSWQYGQGSIWWLVRGEWEDYPALLDALTRYERYLSTYEAVCNGNMSGQM